MKILVTLNLKTREVSKLFERKINGDRLFMEAILHKINSVLSGCRKRDEQALAAYQMMEKNLADIMDRFITDCEKYSVILEKKKNLEEKEFLISAPFKQEMVVTNPLSMQLVEFVSTYDRLIATLKWLHFMGCFGGKGDYFDNVRRYQKIANQGLSGLLLVSVDKKTIS